MSLYMNELGEFVDRDSDIDAENRRKRVYAKLRKTKIVKAAQAAKEAGRKGGEGRSGR